ncbi:MAG: hypothetical protein ACLQLG_06840 [Thermoguttaceae bacterium]
MNKILKRIRTMNRPDLCELSEAINLELQRRMEIKRAIDAAAEKLSAESPEAEAAVLPLPAQSSGPRRAA